MPTAGYRPLTDFEKSILEKLLSVDVPGVTVLRSQMGRAMAMTLDEYGSIKLEINSANRAEFSNGPLVSATQRDGDTVDGYGPFINLLLFVKDGLLNELQIYKDDGGKITSRLDPMKFDLTVDSRLLPSNSAKS